MLPRFRRIAVGISRRISLEKAANRLEGDREVVTRTRGSTIPDSAASVPNVSMSRGYILEGGKMGRTLVVEVQLILVVRTCFVVLKVLPQLLVVGDGSVQGLASRKALSELGPFLADLGVFQQERPAVEVVPPLSVLSALPSNRCQYSLFHSSMPGVQTHNHCCRFVSLLERGCLGSRPAEAPQNLLLIVAYSLSLISYRDPCPVSARSIMHPGSRYPCTKYPRHLFLAAGI